MMAGSTTLEIRVHGKGGHGSVPHLINDVISAGSAIIANTHSIKSRLIDPMQKFVLSITKFESGYTYNVFPDDALILGTLRCYNNTLRDQIKEKLVNIVNSTAEPFGCTAEVIFVDKYPATVNSKTETEHVIRLTKEHFGENFYTSFDLPITGSEDFSFYLLERPGCFFFLGTYKPNSEMV
jgi:amidohydrolase